MSVPDLLIQFFLYSHRQIEKKETQTVRVRLRERENKREGERTPSINLAPSLTHSYSELQAVQGEREKKN